MISPLIASQSVAEPRFGIPKRWLPLAVGLDRRAGAHDEAQLARRQSFLVGVGDHRGLSTTLRSPIGSDVALLPDARHHLVAAHLGTSGDNSMAMLLDDLMVRPSSALGLGHHRAIALEPAERTKRPASNHFPLLKDPRSPKRSSMLS